MSGEATAVRAGCGDVEDHVLRTTYAATQVPTAEGGEQVSAPKHPLGPPRVPRCTAEPVVAGAHRRSGVRPGDNAAASSGSPTTRAGVGEHRPQLVDHVVPVDVDGDGPP
jgi:hypothetical protein